jgi:hypothetical protein
MRVVLFWENSTKTASQGPKKWEQKKKKKKQQVDHKRKLKLISNC